MRTAGTGLNLTRGNSTIADTASPGGRIGASCVGLPPQAVEITSQENVGLRGESAHMSRSVALRPAVAHSGAETIETRHDRYLWRISALHADRIDPAGVDWFHPGGAPGAVLVKKNCHREVWRVALGDRVYFVKLYHPNDLVRRLKLLVRGPTALQEWHVGRYAAEHGINSVVPVAVAVRGFRGAGGPSLLITEAAQPVERLSDYWLRIRASRHHVGLLTDSLAMLIARAHQCGFQHGDMHPGNILVRQVGRRGEALFVDLHNVRIGRSVGLSQVIANLAQLNQWFRRHASLTQRRRFLDRYLAYRDRFAQASPHARNHLIEPKPLVAQLTARAERHARRLWAKRDRRTRRSGRYFARIRPAPGWRGYALLGSKHPSPTSCAAKLAFTPAQWNRWLADPLAWVDPTRHELLKDSHTATICKATLPVGSNPPPVIAKRPLARTFGKRLLKLFTASRSMRAWRTAYMLLNRDLPVAQPLAVVERRTLGCIRIDSVGLTDFVPEALDLETFLTRSVAPLAAEAQRRLKDSLIEAVVKLLRVFGERGFVHRDLKAPNLLVAWAPPYDAEPSLTFIDMEGIRHVRRPTDTQRWRAVARLCTSLVYSPAVTRTDRLRFLKRYLTAPGRSPANWKAHWRTIERDVAEKTEAKEARRVWKLRHYGRE